MTARSLMECLCSCKNTEEVSTTKILDESDDQEGKTARRQKDVPTNQGLPDLGVVKLILGEVISFYCLCL